ncbi:uncharacterized protein LOC115764878 [Drosophila novamexicana]|uniref:uncharacterized protein LOC115764878 n=1 Tax=Drosophila novamexicana TaxID=47314 RepID=UPI0011E5A487|nr:uncharacterized protein LOC115764878 [Drosophila novamexicana]
MAVSSSSTSRQSLQVDGRLREVGSEAGGQMYKHETKRNERGHKTLQICGFQQQTKQEQRSSTTTTTTTTKIKPEKLTGAGLIGAGQIRRKEMEAGTQISEINQFF